MLYKAMVSILVKGDRVARGTEIEMDEKEATRFGEDIEPVAGNDVVEEDVVEEKPLAEMNGAELKAKAEELGLKKSGSNADLIERITLHLEGGEETEEEEITN